ncbi:MAG: hypothetical protein RLZZ505_996 [Verrucomicrobiota bacterium]
MKIRNINDQTNQISASLERTADNVGNWISSTAKSAESAYHDASDGLSHRVEQGKDFCESAYRGARRRANDVGAAAHNHPFSTVLVGMGVAALLTYLLLQRRD